MKNFPHIDGAGGPGWVDVSARRALCRRAAPPALAALLSILIILASGCETTSRARLEAQQAYAQGQQQAAAQSRPKPPIVTVTGLVRNSIIPWTEDLTLAKAIVAAEYTGYFNPKLIRVIRDGQATDIKPSALLNRQDMPLMAGDTIQVLP
jgi:hypothetical protein